MSTKPIPLIAFCKERPLFVALFGAIVIALVKAIADGIKMEENFAGMGNDDIMRLVMVRDWLAGQSWFDTTQYRLVPPEGVLMHWSRYVDAGIAAFIVPLSYVMPMEQAELIGSTLWPTAIFVLTLLVIGLGTRRLFGPIAACFAVLCTIFWPLLTDLHSRAGNLDHHNVQLLMMVILVYAAVWPGRPIVAGAIGGLAAAFALSTGLESLLFIVAVGVVIYGSSVVVATPHARRLLTAFCLALAFGSLIFWLGLTAPDLRRLPVCDQLSTPMLSLIAISMIAVLLPLALSRFLPGPILQVIATVGLTVVGFAIAWPLLGPCVQGPYGDLPPELQEMIRTRVTEAKPFLIYIQAHIVPTLIFMLPVVTALLAGCYLWLSRRNQRGSKHADNRVLGQLLLLGLLGIGMIFLQMRTVIMVAAVVPAIGGVCLAVLLSAYLRTRNIATAAILFIVGVSVIAPQLIVRPLHSYFKEESSGVVDVSADCKTYDALIALNAVPPAVMMNSTNMGASLLWATHHSTLAAPYHRSPAAFMNGGLGFELPEGEFRALTRDMGATHVLLCQGSSYGSDFLTGLATGEVTTDWLRQVPLDHDAPVLFEIVQ